MMSLLECGAAVAQVTVNHLVAGSNPAIPANIRGLAQPGRAPALGAGCRMFESCIPDQNICVVSMVAQRSPKPLVRVRILAQVPA
jgi:hypothetical protein